MRLLWWAARVVQLVSVAFYLREGHLSTLGYTCACVQVFTDSKRGSYASSVVRRKDMKPARFVVLF